MSSAESFTCLVCGYPGMEDRPQDENICPCCATQFGYSDHGTSHKALREAWVEAGMPWRSPFSPVALDWNPVLQLQNVAPHNGTATLDVVQRVKKGVGLVRLLPPVPTEILDSSCVSTANTEASFA